MMVLLMVLPSVFAQEDNATDIQDLNDQINQANDTLNLKKDYTCFDEELNITRDITVEGNNHSFSANDSGEILKINVVDSCNVVIKEINFNLNLQLNSNSSNVTFLNCYFNLSGQCDDEIDIVFYNNALDNAGNVSDTIFKKAKQIAGESSDLTAAKKLAFWVGKNISHETRAGFYQSPEETLKSKKGNCCSQTLLFLQMCEALGITKEHKVYFVHVGTPEFGERHFFAVIDNLCVDVDSKPGSPWGHARVNYDSIFATTQYPLLPLPKEY